MELTPYHDHAAVQQALSSFSVFARKAGDTPGVDLAGAGNGAPAQAGSEALDSKRRLMEAGRQFEAYFISYLMKVMRETIPKGAIANKQGAYFESFYDQEIGLRAAQSGGIGIAGMVEAYVEKNYSPPPAKPSSSSR